MEVLNVLNSNSLITNSKPEKQKGIVDKYIAILDKANKTSACKQVYAGVHKKQLNDPDLNQFFKFKGWL